MRPDIAVVSVAAVLGAMFSDPCINSQHHKKLQARAHAGLGVCAVTESETEANLKLRNMLDDLVENKCQQPHCQCH